MSPGLLNKFTALNIIGKESARLPQTRGGESETMAEEKEVWGLRIVREEEELL